MEDALVAGNTYEDAGTLNLSCTSAGDYIVSIKTASYPVSPTVDNDLSSNVSVSTHPGEVPGGRARGGQAGHLLDAER